MSDVYSLTCTKQRRLWNPVNKDWDIIPLWDVFMGYYHSETKCMEIISSYHSLITTSFIDLIAEGDDGTYGQRSTFLIPDNEEPNIFWLYTITRLPAQVPNIS